MYDFNSVIPVPASDDVQGEWIATTRPCCYALGYMPEEDLDWIAVQALQAGHDVVITYQYRFHHSDYVYDLFVA